MGKFNIGDYVEITKSEVDSTRNVGYRFFIKESARKVIGRGDEVKLVHSTDVPSKVNSCGFKVVPVGNLKLVNPDSDELSEFTFQELMSDLSKQKVGVE